MSVRTEGYYTHPSCLHLSSNQKQLENQTAYVVTAFGPDTHPSCLHLTSTQQQLGNQTVYVVTKSIVVSS